MSESSPKLLDLIPKNREWMMNEENGNARNESSSSSSSDENKKLELRLGLPGDEIWSSQNNNSKQRNYQGFPWKNIKQPSQFLPPQQPHHNHHFQTVPKVIAKESQQQNAEKKISTANTAVTNTSQKRAAPAPVVGWPPIRSFRKNLASTSSAKAVSESQNVIPNKPLNEKPAVENKGLFVKINMDGVPIGRKVNLNAHDSYEKLSSSVDKLFRGLLAAQKDSSDGMMEKKEEEEKAITGLMDGSGEYTLVYEDNEGDRMLVGDVPWHMFVSTVKRLRVLKSSDLPTLSRGGSKAGKMVVESPSK